MTRRSVVLILCAALLFGACARPLPAEKSAYVRQWESPTISLRITQSGNVNYRRQEKGTKISVKGPLEEFDGNNFDVGVGPFKTTFVVSKPPYQDGDQWKMVVDGVELTRVAQ